MYQLYSVEELNIVFSLEENNEFLFASYQVHSSLTFIHYVSCQWQELQQHEKMVKSLEKQKSEAVLKVRELEHKIVKAQKDSRDAAHKVKSHSLIYYLWL